MSKPPPKAPRFPASFPASMPGRVAAKTGVGSATSPSAAHDRLLRPQAHLHQIERERRVQSVPQGLGLDSPRIRQRMVERLQADGISHAAVLDAFLQVPRHLFVDTALVNQAYEDTSLPIGLGQTISKPSVVAAMMQLLCTRPGLGALAARPDQPLGACLEIGTGCGYQAALLACVSTRVISIERLRELHLKARRHLDLVAPQMPRMRISDIRLVHGDGMLGHAPSAPYHTIIAAAGGEAVPDAWLDQLAPGGRLVAPVVSRAGAQVLTIIDRLPDGSLKHTQAGGVLFVPLKSGLA